MQELVDGQSKQNQECYVSKRILRFLIWDMADKICTEEYEVHNILNRNIFILYWPRKNRGRWDTTIREFLSGFTCWMHLSLRNTNDRFGAVARTIFDASDQENQDKTDIGRPNEVVNPHASFEWEVV